MPTTPLASCRRHPSARAGWHCVGCSAALCPECVEARRMHTVDLLACRLCGDRAETLFIHRSEQTPLAERLGPAWRYPLNLHGLITTGVLATVVTALLFMARVSLIVGRSGPALLALGIFWSCFFAIVRSSARGEQEIPAPEYNDVFSDWLLPALRGLLATSVVWFPLFLYAVYVGGWDSHAYRERLMTDPQFHRASWLQGLPWDSLGKDPVAWLLGLAGLAYFPMALLQAAIGPSVLDMLNPVRGIHAIRRLGSDYALTLGALLTLGLLLLVARSLGSSLRALDGGFITDWFAELVEAPVPFVMAHVLGLLLYARGDVLGYGDVRDYLTPVLPDATPSTSLRVEGLGTPEPVAVEATRSADKRVRELTEAVQTRDVPAALSLYAELATVPQSAITPAVHLFVGQAASTYGDHALAVRALESAADVAPEDPIAPRALVLLARVLGERMQELARAQDVYRYIVDRYPDTDASRFAQAHLAPTS